MPGGYGEKRLLHLVFGGAPKKLGGMGFRDLDALGIAVHVNWLFAPNVKGSGSF
jgi:hypothetical protein